jgi:hypothetical protein
MPAEPADDDGIADFRKLLEQSTPENAENSRLALIRPAKMEEQPYDTIRQEYSLRLLDGQGRDLWVTVPYDHENARVIDELEWLTKGTGGSTPMTPVFFASLYRDGDRLKCYPIEYFKSWEESE